MTVNTSLPKVLFVGLGMMGRPMATLIAQAGYPLLVSDTDKNTVMEVCHLTGAPPLSSADDLSSVDIVITNFANFDKLNQVLLGAPGLAERLSESTCIIDMSNSDPLNTKSLAKELETRALNFLDIAVSWHTQKEASGKLAIVIGGDANIVQKYIALFAALGTFNHVGSVGAGHSVRALNNYVSSVCTSTDHIESEQLSLRTVFGCGGF